MTDILVLGADGYTGYPLYHHLTNHGYDIHGVDHCLARAYRGQSVIPLETPTERFGNALIRADITNYEVLHHILADHAPSTIVNLAQIPSAPYSMQGVDEAWHTQENNIRGALNLYWAIHNLGLDVHVIQLATMGEYGTPETSIPEGFLGDGRPAPKEPGSLYHASKVNTTTNTLFLSRTWDIPTTEVYQGVVYGIPDTVTTRFDVDSVWGTVLNRFTAQAATGHPLSVYGRGGQKRAMLSITDCVRCIRLLIDNPPTRDGVGGYPYRAVNQFDGAYRVSELADMIQYRTGVEISHVGNPRVEDDSEHVYAPERDVLDSLGYEPTRGIMEEFERAYEVVCEYRDRVNEDVLLPDVSWV